MARINWSGVHSAHWIGAAQDIISPTFGPLTGPHLPAFKITFILLVIPSVIALLAENSGHVKAVSEMTGDDLDPYLGRAFIGDGVGTALASLVGGSPTTTYAENIGVMAATRIYSTLAYYIAAVVAILFGFCPKFGAVVAATPGGVLGGITLVLYGMIGLLGAKIWIENRVDFADPGQPGAAGGRHHRRHRQPDDQVHEHLLDHRHRGRHTDRDDRLPRRAGSCRREGMKDEPVAAGRAYEGGAAISTGNIETPEGEVSPFREDGPAEAGPDPQENDQQ